MSRFQILKSLMNKHRSQLVLTYILFSLEMLGGLLRPFFLGWAINDLMKSSYNGLIILSAVHIVTLAVGTLRHMYDTRTYSAIYVSLVTKFLSRRIYQKDVSKLSAHSTLAREFVDFLEFDLVYVIEAAYNIFGSLILMFFYDGYLERRRFEPGPAFHSLHIGDRPRRCHHLSPELSRDQCLFLKV